MEGCNAGGANVEIRAAEIVVAPLVMTTRACAGPQATVEATLAAVLRGPSCCRLTGTYGGGPTDLRLCHGREGLATSYDGLWRPFLARPDAELATRFADTLLAPGPRLLRATLPRYAVVASAVLLVLLVVGTYAVGLWRLAHWLS